MLPLLSTITHYDRQNVMKQKRTQSNAVYKLACHFHEKSVIMTNYQETVNFTKNLLAKVLEQIILRLLAHIKAQKPIDISEIDDDIIYGNGHFASSTNRLDGCFVATSLLQNLLRKMKILNRCKIALQKKNVWKLPELRLRNFQEKFQSEYEKYRFAKVVLVVSLGDQPFFLVI